MRDKAKQTRFNFYTNILTLIVNILVGLYYTPFLINNLGLIAYGILPLALIINQYLSVASQTLTHAYTRFYSISLQKEDYFEASKNISTSMVVVIILCALILPLGMLIICKANTLFSITPELLTSAKQLFLYTILSFIISLFSSLLNVTLYAINRLDLMNVLKVIRTILKFILLILLFEITEIDVAYVGLSNLTTELLLLGTSIIFYFKYKPKEVTISLSLYNKEMLYAIMGMSIWVLIQLLGDTLLYRTDNLIINHYWGLEASGALGAVSEICNYVMVGTSVLGSLFGPLILISYAKGKHDEVVSLFVEHSIIVGCISAILAGTITGMGSNLLNLWLGNNMGKYSWWLFLKMLVVPFYTSGGIMAFVYRSWNKLKLPAIGTIILGVLDFAILILFCEIVNTHSVIIILSVSTIFSILQCFILNAIAVGRIYKQSRKAMFKIFIKISFSFIICYIVSSSIMSVVPIKDLLTLAGVLVVTSLIMFLIILFFVFSINERKSLFKLIK